MRGYYMDMNAKIADEIHKMAGEELFYTLHTLS